MNVFPKMMKDIKLSGELESNLSTLILANTKRERNRSYTFATICNNLVALQWPGKCSDAGKL